MSVMEMSIMHHVCIVLFSIWLLSYFDKCHPVAFFVSFIYLFLVHETYVMRLQKKLQFEERKQANQKRVLTDSETVRWLNHAMEKIWPICMENIASQKILLPIIPWFLEKYKPWTAKKALVQHMYLGRNPPLITEMRVLRQCSGDDHLVLELGMNFLTADDMSAILAVKLRKRLGFGMWAKLHMTGMHVEGKVLVGVKFLREWPYLGRLRVCFAEPPYFQMTVKPIFTHGLDVTELPGIAGWLDKLLSVAFEQTLVQPNMLVVDMEKFVSPKGEDWFSVDEKQPVAYAKVEVVEASDMKPSDLNGLADPYVKGQLGHYRFKTKIQKKTLSPKWNEEFKVPIISWDFDNKLTIGVRDKDHFVDDTLGDCTVKVNELRDGERHDMWVPLENIKMGRLHLAITILEENVKDVDNTIDGETLKKEDVQDSFASDTDNRASFSSVSSVKSPRVADNYEPINIEGQEETGVWVHRPGSEVSQTWEPRKGKNRNIDTEVLGVPTSPIGGWQPAGSGTANNSDSSSEDATEVKHGNRVRRGLQKIGSVFHRNSKKEDSFTSIGETVQSPYANIRSLNEKEIGVKFIVEDSELRRSPGKGSNRSLDENGEESPGRGNVKGMAKSILKHAEKSARNIKHVLSRKGSRKSLADSSVATDCDTLEEPSSSNDDSLSSPQVQETPTVSSPKSPINVNDDLNKTEEVAAHNCNKPAMDVEGSIKDANAERTEKLNDKVSSSNEPDSDSGLDKSLPPVSEENLEEQKK